VYDDCARQQQLSRRIHPDRVSYQLEGVVESDSLNKCSDACVRVFYLLNCVHAYVYIYLDVYDKNCANVGALDYSHDNDHHVVDCCGSRCRAVQYYIVQYNYV
jgi:hypothetical protein